MLNQCYQFGQCLDSQPHPHSSGSHPDHSGQGFQSRAAPDAGVQTCASRSAEPLACRMVTEQGWVTHPTQNAILRAGHGPLLVHSLHSVSTAHGGKRSLRVTVQIPLLSPTSVGSWISGYSLLSKMRSVIGPAPSAHYGVNGPQSFCDVMITITVRDSVAGPGRGTRLTSQ